MIRRWSRFMLAVAAVPLLGGCVAALAPIAAGGVIFGKDRIGGKNKPAESEIVAEAAQPEVAQASEPAAAAPVELAATENTLAENTVATTPRAELPPAKVTQTPAAPLPPTGAADLRAYDVLYRYVDLQSRREPTDLPRQSALLAAPGTLDPVRTDCSIRPPAILIDLDPGTGIFDPEDPVIVGPALTQILAALRLQAVDVFWISQLAAVEAGSVRKSLIASGLDPSGRDGLLLMRRVDDRKQARRKELGETHCVLAIAGDRRADFDELYDYLKNESAAQPLEELIGSGWFLTPTLQNPTPQIPTASKSAPTGAQAKDNQL